MPGTDRREFPAAHYLFREGERGKELYMLVSGEVEVSLGGQVIAAISEGGSIFGEMSFLLGGPRSATIRTTRPSEFLVIHDADTLVAAQPALMARIAKILAQRLKEMDERFVSIRRAVIGT